MKKINLILGAVAAVALLASCSNGSKDYKNVKTTDYTYAYTVTGSVTTTVKSGTNTAYETTVTAETIKTAIAQCTYTEDALNTRNYDAYKINIGGKAESVSTVTPAGATTANPSRKETVDFGTAHFSDSWYSKSISIPAGWYYTDLYNYYYNGMQNGFYGEPYNATPVSTDLNDTSYATYCTEVSNSFSGNVRYKKYQGTYLDITIQDFDGDYFIGFNNEFIALPEDALDGFIGDDEFTLTYSTTKDNRDDLSEAEHTNAAGDLDTTTVEYKFTFKLVEAE